MFHGCLRAFDETVRYGSMRRASESLGVAPSSVSRHIAMLEHQMGTSLFDRRGGSLTLTYAGRLVADYTRSVLMEYDALRTDLDDAKGTQRRLLRLALVEDVAAGAVMAAISRFKEAFPAVSFNIRLLPGSSVVDAVMHGQCDMGLGYCVEPHPEIRTLASFADPLVLVVAADYAVDQLARIDLATVASLPLALPDAETEVRALLDKAAAAAGIRLNQVMSSNAFGPLRDFARSSVGAAILPMRAVERPEHVRGLRLFPISGGVLPEASIDLIVARARRQARVVNAFVEMLIEQIATAKG